jgi:hypothetical protein
MLNELSQVVEAIERLGTSPPSRHPRITPMGKNKNLLVVCVAKNGSATRVEILRGELAATLFRVEHGSAGSSFPGFNLPTPLRQLNEVPIEKLELSVENLLTLTKSKNIPNNVLSDAIDELFALSSPRAFTASQEKQFQRSCDELVAELRATLASAPAELKNFLTLLAVVGETRPTLQSFSDSLTAVLVQRDAPRDRGVLLLSEEILFGVLDWKKRAAKIGSADYWKEKAKQEKSANQPIYLDLAEPDSSYKRVAHAESSALINDALLQANTSTTVAVPDELSMGVDAYTGQSVELQDKFPSPKIVELGNLKLFSVNTNEVRALRRYGLEGAKIFPVSAALTQRMSDALLYLAREENRGVSCRAIPSAQPDKRDLLVAYLEGELEFREQVAEMFGGETNVFSDADFAAIAQPVLEMLEGKIAANPNLDIRLLAFSSIDKGRKQISLNRRFRVADVIRAARDWQTGARNVPEVSVWFYDKSTKQSIFRAHVTPTPLDLASTANRVWSADAKAGFSSSFQRALSSSDAYDIFMVESPLAQQKTSAALGLLVRRMTPVLAALGAVKTTREWTSLSDTVRWQSLKSVAAFGILLHQLGQQKENFMNESITELGRLLALADSLHLQYCKHVRKGESPSQLIGNALFNTALEQPVFALALLGERLTPYQAWARTFQSNEPDAGVGLVKYFLSEMAGCTAAIKLEQLPAKMSDADKAKLMLGYLADHSKEETPKK